MKKLDKNKGFYMSSEEINEWVDILRSDWENYLKKFQIKFPKKGSAKLLHLVFLKKNEGILVHKDTISNFVHTVIPEAGKDQQVRHLGSDGWNVLNKNDKLPQSDEKVPSGYHVLISTETLKQSFMYKVWKRAGRVNAKNFEQLKAVYNLRCATCGSGEGKPHLQEETTVVLQQGHMNPFEKLTIENTIPQCQIRNQSYKDNYFFNEKGRVSGIASLGAIKKAPDFLKKDIKEFLGNL